MKKERRTDLLNILGQEDRYIHVDEAMAITTLAEVTIRRYLAEGKLRRFKAGRRTLLKLSEVLSLIREA